MNAPTLYLRPDVTAYVSAVRVHLDDLSAEVVDELTGGLEADLTELAAESADPLESRVGPPSAYADELRAAAGLPPRADRGGWWARERARWQRDLGRLSEQSWWPGVRDFALAVRPAWWVARAFAAAVLLFAVLGTVLMPAVAFVALGVLSVELGRGRWHGGFARVLAVAGNVATVVVLVAIALTPSAVSHNGYVETYPASSVPGLSRDGQPVTNVFPYDAQGRLLSGVQLFDQDGQPLAVDPDVLPVDTTYQDDGSELRREAAPSIDAYGQQVWNVFPLSTVERRYPMDGSAPTPLSSPTAAPPRATMVPPLLDASTPTSGPVDAPTSTTDGATGGATDGATPGAAPSASPTGAATGSTSIQRPSRSATPR